MSRAPQGRPQVGHGASVFQSRAGALEHVYRLAEQLDAAPSAVGQAGRPQRHPDRARAFGGLSERDLFGCERSRFGLCAEREVRETGEYPDIYRRFAELVERRESQVDTVPLQLVADCLLVGSRKPA